MSKKFKIILITGIILGSSIYIMFRNELRAGIEFAKIPFIAQREISPSRKAIEVKPWEAVSLEKVYSGFKEPLYLVEANDNSGSIYVVEKGGKIIAVTVSEVNSTAEANFCESVESGHSSHDASARIAEILNVTAKPARIDSQCKYGVLARGEASIYLRLPTNKDYEEKIWDHAAGYIVVKEAGGEVTDCKGNNLDFSLGRTLKNNKGIVGTNGRIHDEVVKAVIEVIS